MSNSKSFVWGAVSVLAAFLIGALVSGLLVKGHFKAILDTFEPQRDTLYLQDTTKHLRPVSVGSPILTGKDIKIPLLVFLPDSVKEDSTALAHLPDSLSLLREQVEYKDSTYHAWVSGVSPQLDSIYVFPKHTIITNTVPVPVVKKQRLTVGVQGGVGVVQPFAEPFSPKVGYYAGIGFTWNF
jgi:hypothetical protein